MGGEISIKEKEPGERGTCFGFNVLLKLSERQEPQDIEEGTSGPSSDPPDDSSLRASVFQEATSFKGTHCVLYVHGVETRRIMQTWMESIGMKVWLVPQVEFTASTLEKVRHISMSPTRGSSPTVSHDGIDRCFSSKDVVSQVLPMVLRNNTFQRCTTLGGGHPSGLLVVIDVSNGGLEDVSHEMVKFSGTKHQTPCKLVFLADLKTTSGDLRRFSELGCDLVLRKPMHGSRLYAILRTLRELQASDAQSSSQVGPAEVAGTSHQPESPGILLQDVQGTPAATEVEAQKLKKEDDKPLAGMHVLLAEDSLVLQTIQRRMLSQLGATVKLAVDGSEALKLYKEALEQAIVSEKDAVQLPYDVIFMDCEVCSTEICYYLFILIE
jgi:DNA-binding response OmpR family regulator